MSGPAQRNLSLVLAGGGARAAYQVGVLTGLARRFPDLRIPILVGVSAGAVNAVHLASHPGPFAVAVADLGALWRKLTPQRIFRVDAPGLGHNVLRWGTRLLSGGLQRKVRSLLDTAPLRRLLREHFATDGFFRGIAENVRRGNLAAVAISGTSYTTGQSTVWAEGTRDIEPWTRPRRRGVPTTLTMDHVMASAALPLFFPAVRIDGAWYGDGGVRLAEPLSPAIHLGADRILVIATQDGPSSADPGRPADLPYPPPAQVLGLLLDAVFLDALDEDALCRGRGPPRGCGKRRPSPRHSLPGSSLATRRCSPHGARAWPLEGEALRMHVAQRAPRHGLLQDPRRPGVRSRGAGGALALREGK